MKIEKSLNILKKRIEQFHRIDQAIKKIKKKIPNFEKIHNSMYNKQEDLSEYRERKKKQMTRFVKINPRLAGYPKSCKKPTLTNRQFNNKRNLLKSTQKSLQRKSIFADRSNKISTAKKLF